MLDKNHDTIDAFHKGRFFVVQPKDKGHRSGIDAMLLASVVPKTLKGHVLDVGAGAGAAGFAVLSRCPQSEVTLVENSPLMLEYAKKTLALPENRPFSSRASLIDIDFSGPANQQTAAGLKNNHYDYILMNPPFNCARDRKTPDLERQHAHIMADDMFETWLKRAAGLAKANGYVAIIARPQSLEDILAALKRRFGAVKIVPILPAGDKHAIRVIIIAQKGSKAALALGPGLTLHAEDKSFTPRSLALINGQACLQDGV